MRDRPLSSVPWPVLALLAAGLAAQVGWSLLHPPQRPAAADLPPAPPETVLRLAALGEPAALGKMLMLYVQTFDSQAGAQLPYMQFDYARLEAWLDATLQLDPRGQYPLFAASRLYAEVADPVRKRRMLDFVHRRFADDPARRWPALAHASVVAKHQLKDLPLARSYAADLRIRGTEAGIPGWATQMEAFILEDMNEIESAKVLLGGMLASGQVSDPNERRFLMERLERMEAKGGKS
ncbi:MAG TPA: hypothetical protein VIM12_13245 [Noviherbaspirillum sp.]|jgi:hypothetical protein|uniref:hypothetical protein n=1 Tax=Noviherbaspirillum sp. TaxID=1926288 RepID=UPI002F92C491